MLTAFEAEHMARELAPLRVEDVGGEKWSRQYEIVGRLNAQAHHDALSRHDEFVVEAVAAVQALPALVNQLVVSEVWRERVLPRMLATLPEVSATKAYMVLFHEATVCNLLEVLVYHARSVEDAEETVVDLIDYCYRRLSYLNALIERGQLPDAAASDDAKRDNKEPEPEHATRLRAQANELAFSTAVSAASVLRFLTDHVSVLPVSALSRLLDHHDVILALVPLALAPPWTRRGDDGKLLKFVDQKWVPVPESERMRLTKTEAQVWLAIYNLVMDKACRARYHFTRHRKEALLRLRGCFNEVLVDQLPLLRDLHRTVEEMAVVEPVAPTQAALCVVEAMSELYERLTRELDADSVARAQLQNAFSADKEKRAKEMARLAGAINIDLLEELMSEPTCAAAGCGKAAVKRCSRCKLDWYCSRECQVRSWPAHKAACDAAAAKAKTQSPPAAPSATAAPQKIVALD